MLSSARHRSGFGLAEILTHEFVILTLIPQRLAGTPNSELLFLFKPRRTQRFLAGGSIFLFFNPILETICGAD